jgi:hypothetical protein
MYMIRYESPITRQQDHGDDAEDRSGPARLFARHLRQPQAVTHGQDDQRKDDRKQDDVTKHRSLPVVWFRISKIEYRTGNDEVNFEVGNSLLDIRYSRTRPKPLSPQVQIRT